MTPTKLRKGKKRGRKPNSTNQAPKNAEYGPLLASGMSYSDVAAACGVTRQEVHRWALRWMPPGAKVGPGLKVGRPKSVTATFEEIDELRKQFDAKGNQLGWRVIGEKLGASKSSVMRIYREGRRV